MKDRTLKYHINLANYFSEQPLYRHINSSKYVNIRRVSELPWQLSIAKLWNKLVIHLTIPRELNVLFSLFNSDVKRYWKSIESFSSISMSNTYESFIKNPSINNEIAFSLSDLLEESGYPSKAVELLKNLCQYYNDIKDDEGIFASLTRGIIFTVVGVPT